MLTNTIFSFAVVMETGDGGISSFGADPVRDIVRGVVVPRAGLSLDLYVPLAHFAEDNV